MRAPLAAEPTPTPPAAEPDRRGEYSPGHRLREVLRRCQSPRGRRAVRYGLVLLVLAVSVLAQPRPGVHGAGLVALAGLAGVCGGGGALVWLRSGRRPSPAAQLGLFALVLAASVALVWVEPDGRGFLGGYVLCSVAASRESPRLGAGVTAVALGVLGLAGLAAPHHSAMAVLVGELGMAAFHRVGRYSRRLRERTEEAERLTAEVERTKAAQLRAATLGERQRLAREMHDVLAHSLSGLLIHLEAARLLAERESAGPRLTDAIRRAHRLAEAGLGEARQAIGTLRDAELPGPERLPALAEEFTRDTGLPCELRCSGRPVPLGPESGLTLYRVAQEALTNVRRHARAPGRVELRLDWEPEGVRLAVEDLAHVADAEAPADVAAAVNVGGVVHAENAENAENAEDVGNAAAVADVPHIDAGAGATSRAGRAGVPGPRVGPAGEHGYGLTGMRERAALLDGTLTAQPTPRGFLVRLWLPKGASGR